MNYYVQNRKLVFGVIAVVVVLITVTLALIFGGREQEELIDVTSYELPAVIKDYIKENPKIKNSYISGTKIYTAMEQEIKNTTVYTYYVLHLLLPEEGVYYDIEDKKGTEFAYFEGDTQDYLYNTEETYYTQVIQVVKDKKGDYTVYTY